MTTELTKLRIDKSHKASRHHRPVWPWVVAAFVIVGAGFGVWKWQTASPETPVTTIRVRLPDPGTSAAQSELVALDAQGYIVAAHRVELASKVVGRVAKVGVEMGDKVTAGEPLVWLEDDEYRARVEQQQGQLDNAQARLDELLAGSRPEEIARAQANLDEGLADLANAQRNLDRLKQMSGSQTISRKEFDDAETLAASRTAAAEALRQQLNLMKAGPRKEQIAAQRATVRQLAGGLALSQVDLKNTVISAPNDATVLRRNVEVGEFVTNGFVGDRGAKGYVVSIADLNDLRVELDISQANFAKVTPDQPCWIIPDAYPDRKYEGVVDLISPEANRQKGSIQVRVKVLHPDEFLRPDMDAKVSFLSQSASATRPAGAVAPKPAIRVPSSAVIENAVFVVDAGRVVKRSVTVGGKTADGQIEILKGLIGGEDLIVEPAATLKDGDRVRTVEKK